MPVNPIPVLDLSKTEQECIDVIRKACTSHGVFYIVNHSVPWNLVEKQFEESKKFFELPQEEKEKLFVTGAIRGYAPIGAQIGDMKEALYLGGEDPAVKHALTAPNIWPDEKLVPDFRNAMEAYKDAVTELTHKLLKIVAQSLGLDKNYFDKMYERPLICLKPQRYVGDISEPEKGKFAGNQHCDFGTFTFLVQDTPGLQVFLDNQWVDVQIVEKAFICHVGNLLKRWTNDVFQSPLHRVLKLTSENRYSTGFFIEASCDTIVECLPTCVGEGKQYEPVNVGEYFMDCFKATHSLETKIEN